MIDVHLDGTIKNSRILVVDDNEQNLQLVEAILSDAGYSRIELVQDPRMVMGLVTDNPPDAILLDIRMPVLDGHQLLALLRETYQEDYLPVIVLTAHADKGTCRRALGAGARDFLAKPIDPDELVLRVTNLLETWHLYRFRKRHAEILANLVDDRTSQLRQAHMDVILRLGRAGEYRDSDTGRHVVRMSRYCQLLATHIGMDAQWAELILYASPMHDVGKIGIPDQILLKPGSLTEDERAVIQRHVDIGMDILQGGDTPLITMARNICETHHERWDGQGYLQGLKGEEIPLEGRIAALCDVFDALVSHRPYKKAWPIEDVITMLRSESGRAFEPRLVEAFIANMDGFVAIKDELAD